MDDKFPIDNEEQFFHNLFVEYYPSLCSFALRYVGDGEVVEDLVQDVFVKLWETRERWRAVADFSAYVYQMVRYRCFNYLRGERLRDKAVEGFAEEIDVTEINGYIAEETFRIVRDARLAGRFLNWCLKGIRQRKLPDSWELQRRRSRSRSRLHGRY